MTTNDSWDEADLAPPGQLPSIPEVTLLRELARGGMGIVYRGRQDFLERDVAVKLLAPQMQDERFAARFRREAKLLAGIKHPHIVACYAAGVTPQGQHYLVMELVEGPTLERWLAQNGPVPLRSALRLCGQLANALGHACELGVIHRDVKTANILLEAPTGTSLDPLFPFVPKLVDLGLARLVAGSTDLAQTAPGSVMGTPATMAPEQFDAPDAVDFRADIYGLGCVLYELLTGAPAFPSQRLTELVVQKRQPRGPNPCAHDVAIPPAVGDLVASMLAHDPAERPADYRTLRARLDQLAASPQATLATKLSLPTQPPSGPTSGPTPKPASNDNLLRTAEFDFLAAGHDAARVGAEVGGSAFVSRVVTPESRPNDATVAPAAADRSLVATPPSPNSRPPAVTTPTNRTPRVVGPRLVASAGTPRRAHGRAATFAGVALLLSAAVPWWWPRPEPNEPPPVAWERLPKSASGVEEPSAGSQESSPETLAAGASQTALGATGRAADAPAPTERPEVELLGLDGSLRRGVRLLVKSRVHGFADESLRYAWSVDPANAAALATPDAAATALRHELLPGDAFTLRLHVDDGARQRELAQRVVVRYDAADLLADFFTPDGAWQPNGRVQPIWRRRDDGAIVVAAGDEPCIASRGLDGVVWRLAGTMLPERSEARGPELSGGVVRAVEPRGPEARGQEPRGPLPRGPEPRGGPPRGPERRGMGPRPGWRGAEPRGPERGPEPAPTDGERQPRANVAAAAGFAQAVVGLRLAGDRHLALVCSRSGADGERWSLSLQQLVEDPGREGLTLRSLPEAAGKAIAATGATGATYEITRRNGELVVQFGFAGRAERGEYREALPRGTDDVGLTLFARSGRVVFVDLVRW